MSDVLTMAIINKIRWKMKTAHRKTSYAMRKPRLPQQAPTMPNKLTTTMNTPKINSSVEMPDKMWRFIIPSVSSIIFSIIEPLSHFIIPAIVNLLQINKKKLVIYSVFIYFDSWPQMNSYIAAPIKKNKTLIIPIKTLRREPPKPEFLHIILFFCL